jgi:hypothetical protein
MIHLRLRFRFWLIDGPMRFGAAVIRVFVGGCDGWHLVSGWRSLPA